MSTNQNSASNGVRTGKGSAMIAQNGSVDMPQYAWEQYSTTGQQNQRVRTNAVRSNASLPDNSWEVVDDAVYRVYEDSTVLVGDLRGAGLTKTTDLMAKIDTWQVVDDSGSASVVMDPETAESESTVTFGPDGVPVPIVQDEFSVGFRDTPPAGGNNPSNESLDTLGAEVCARNVTETLEEMVFTGWDQSINSGGDSFRLYGMTNHPDVNTSTLSADWTTDPSVIRGDFRTMRSVLKNDNNISPGGTGFWAYLSTDLYDTLDDADPEGDGNLTVRDRVENLANIGRIREAEFLPDSGVLMFRPTRDVIDLGIAADLQTVQWDDPFRDHWRVLSSIYPRVKSTSTGQSGIAYFTLP